MGELLESKYANWIQFALLVVTLFALALHGEGRLARVEQQNIDAEKDRAEIHAQLDRIEGTLETWRPSHN
jgi:hypothetical protein